MLLDGELFLSRDQVLGTSGTPATGPVVSTNAYDLGEHGGNIGAGEKLYLTSRVTTVFAGLTSLRLEVIVANNEALTTNAVIIARSETVNRADLDLNSVIFQIPIPKTLVTTAAVEIPNANTGAAGSNLPPAIPSTFLRRYFGVRYAIMGNSTGGAISTWINLDIPEEGDYPNNYEVSINTAALT